MAGDPYDLERFLAAQEDVWPDVVAELEAGAKRSHWMWFVFPQIAGLGGSPTAVRYAIGSLEEAQAYLVHPLLGARLREAAALLLGHRDRDAAAVLGAVDAMKLRSSMTLFAAADPKDPLFPEVLGGFFEAPDPRTLSIFGL